VILVTVGSSTFPFDRLLRAVDALPRDEELVVQHGASGVRPAGARCVEFLPFDDLAALVRQARVVVTHAGVGSILLALSNGRHPVVVPRLRSFGETVDDHQLECARRFGRDGLVTVVEDPALLGAALAAASDSVAGPAEAADVPLVLELKAYIRAAVASAGAAA
jgi:UDP-N-acetylglucosamine transferase subunit ALG13